MGAGFNGLNITGPEMVTTHYKTCATHTALWAGSVGPGKVKFEDPQCTSVTSQNKSATSNTYMYMYHHPRPSLQPTFCQASTNKNPT